ncbi:MAG: hypothetical protein II787_05535 [Lachnospiraceae bacterium]|nr:hypothetical protein [Lachnospiraceae bacterium]
MQAIQYVALIFGLLGFIGYCQLSTLKQRISALEEQLSKIQGTTYFETRQALRGQIESLIGKPVTIEMKEDLEDADIISYGNTRHGSNTILEADDDWIKVRIDTPKGSREKLIRMESLLSICEDKDQQ